MYNPPYPDWAIYSLWGAAGLVLIAIVAYAIYKNQVKLKAPVRKDADEVKIPAIVFPDVKPISEERTGQQNQKTTRPTLEKPVVQSSTPAKPVPKKPEEPNTTTTKSEKKPAPVPEPKREPEQKPKPPAVAVVVPPPPPKIVQPAPEEQSQPKHIGYHPLNIFLQAEPYNYPYVLMPKPGCVIKFPRRGRMGRKGYTEVAFLAEVQHYFRTSFQIYDDRFVLIKNSDRPLEPDITLIDEKNGINLFVDIEIDEPYEGINDIARRKATHYIGCDTNRNNALKSRGWITIRFAEIQVHQQPQSCCLFIADVIKSIHPAFTVPAALKQTNEVRPIAQWTKEQAETWSKEKYREKYLGIPHFGTVLETERMGAVEETTLGEEIEEKVIEEPAIPTPSAVRVSVANPLLQLIEQAKASGHFIACIYNDQSTIVKPVAVAGQVLTCHCYVKNGERQLQLSRLKEATIKDAAFSVEAKGPSLGVNRIREIVQTAIRYKKYIRIRYTKRAWPELTVDEETGEIRYLQLNPAEVSVRTISNVLMSADALDLNEPGHFWVNDNYITAYCNLRDEQRTFKFDRISEIAILNI